MPRSPHLLDPISWIQRKAKIWWQVPTGQTHPVLQKPAKMCVSRYSFKHGKAKRRSTHFLDACWVREKRHIGQDSLKPYSKGTHFLVKRAARYPLTILIKMARSGQKLYSRGVLAEQSGEVDGPCPNPPLAHGKQAEHEPFAHPRGETLALARTSP